MRLKAYAVRKCLVVTDRALLSVSPLLLASPVQAQEEFINGPRSLIVTYRTAAKERAAFRRYLTDIMALRWRALQNTVGIGGFRIYYSWYGQPRVWDTMLVLHFPTFEAVSRWNNLERAQPRGLDPKGLGLAEPSVTIAVDLPRAKNADALRDREVYYMFPYEYPSGPEYSVYVKGYVLPQADGWVREGALPGYELYMNRYPVGPSWDTLFVQKYRNVKAFGRRQEVRNKVRTTLRDDLVWKAFRERKAKIRNVTENSIAELIAH